MRSTARPPLFITETLVTRDEMFNDKDEAWGNRPTAPPGDDWRIVDSLSNEKRTRWERRRPVPTRRGWS
jgi:hypothetical protein